MAHRLVLLYLCKQTIDQYLARGLRSAREYSDRQMFRLIGGGRILPPMEDSGFYTSTQSFLTARKLGRCFLSETVNRFIDGQIIDIEI